MVSPAKRSVRSPLKETDANLNQLLVISQVKNENLNIAPLKKRSLERLEQKELDLNNKRPKIERGRSVSYTHLDVYKRQILDSLYIF